MKRHDHQEQDTSHPGKGSPLRTRPLVGALRFGLSAKFIATLLVILTATMAANTWYAVHTSMQRQEEQLHERGRALGRLVSLISPQAILAFDYLQLNDYTREVSSQPNVVYGIIVTPAGMPMSAYIRGANAATTQQFQADGQSSLSTALREISSDGDLIALEFPIVHNRVELGRFLVGLSRESLHQEVRRQLGIQLCLFVAIVLFLGAAIYAVFRINVLLPIQKLIAASRGVGRGEYHVVNVKSADEFGLLASAFNVMVDEVKQKQEKLHRQANFDALTGLPNRMMAFERINLEINRSKRSQEQFALMFIDLDDFKDVNDTLGHAAGDCLLVDLGARLQQCLRESDSVSRLGGDEFLILIPGVADEVEIERIAARILAAVAEPQVLNGRKVVAKCSIGIALYPQNGESVEVLMANVDNAMYQAKAARGGSAMFFTEDMNIRLRERMSLAQDLRVAAELGQLALYFQPICDVASGCPKGAEVLLRWFHPERGFISPADFIPVAESSGQIVQIGDWVLEQACRCWAEWRRNGIDPGYLAINVSGHEFVKSFPVRIAELMAAYEVPPRALELEITERVLLEDHEQVAEVFAGLRRLGVKLALDDFGTGYSALSYLKRFRFDHIKVDKSFVAGLPGDPDDASVVKAVLAMATGLDLQVVAEGVEKPEQLQFLAAQGCTFAQGYLLAKPMDKASYERYLQSRQTASEPHAPWRLISTAHTQGSAFA
jgi:diguanylate cyclase (GGDEF)-like protein